VIFDPAGETPLSSVFWIVITPLVALGPPIAIGIGIVRYRLYDIDVVIRKTVIVAVVGFILTVLYVAVLAAATLAPVSRAVVGVLLVALTFNPVRRAARAIGDRVAYGKRASSYEVLSDFSGRIADTYAIDDVLPRMATVLAEGTAATTATVWLRVGSELRPVATQGGEDATAMALERGELPTLAGEACEIRQAGELLGALSVTMPANDPLDDARRSLMQDMAAQAGLVLRNARLIEELRASRQRLVAAQDEERRKLERNIHDGAQQQLVALSVQLKLARTMLDRDAARAGTMLDGLGDATTQALEDLRDLARGIYPPLLADRGLQAALEAQARRAALPVAVAAEGIGRYGQDVEAAVYFCALEALNNIAKYAHASRARVSLGQTNGSLSFTVTDDGAGFDIDVTSYGTGLQGMADRLEAVGGSLRVESAPGAGTTVTGTVPVGSGQTEAASQAASSRSGPNEDLGM
jgi:signal transduction histidine kinase